MECPNCVALTRERDALVVALEEQVKGLVKVRNVAGRSAQPQAAWEVAERRVIYDLADSLLVDIQAALATARRSEEKEKGNA